MIANNELMQTLEAVRAVAAEQCSDVDTIIRCVLIGALDEINQALRQIPAALADGQAEPQLVASELHERIDQLTGELARATAEIATLKQLKAAWRAQTIALEALADRLQTQETQIAGLDKSLTAFTAALQTHAELHEKTDA